MGGVIPAGAASGQTVYAQILSAADATIGNGVNLEAYVQGNWANYVNAMPEQSGSSRYILTVPGYLPNGRYFAMPYIQNNPGGSPQPGDTPIDIIFFDWRDGNVLGYGSALNVGQINGSAAAAVNLAVSAAALVPGAAIAGTLSTSQMTTNLTNAVDDIYNGRVLIFTSGANLGLAALITNYAADTFTITFIAYGNLGAPVAPSDGDTFIIL